MNTLYADVATLVAIVPAALLAFRRPPRADLFLWAVLALATLVPAARVAAGMSAAWPTNLAATLWLTIAVTLALFVAFAAVTGESWRLTPLLSAYMLMLGVLATALGDTPGRPATAGDDAWFGVHVAVTVPTYGLVTLAAVAALAAFLQERSLKRRRPPAIGGDLPSVAACETLVFRALAAGVGVLAMGLLTGMALTFRATGHPLSFDHKTVLTVAAFIVIAGLLWAHARSGVRGRRAARLVLLAYLLLTLGYPGVKFVADVLLA